LAMGLVITFEQTYPPCVLYLHVPALVAGKPVPALEDVRPPCPRCAKQMNLVRTTLDERGLKLRTFECSKCAHTEGWVFKPLSIVFVHLTVAV
jgi:hypothetical protein